MAGSLRILPVLCALTVLNSSAHAFGGRSASRPMGAVACAPAPIIYCVPAIAPSWAVPTAAPPDFQPVPTPAPTPKLSPRPQPVPGPTTKEPPLRAPSVIESRSQGGVMPAEATELAPGRCKIGFWNITGADVTLTVDGQERKLPKDRAVTLELGRTFVWQVSGRGPQTVRVPDGQNVFEVILRP